MFVLVDKSITQMQYEKYVFQINIDHDAFLDSYKQKELFPPPNL